MNGLTAVRVNNKRAHEDALLDVTMKAQTGGLSGIRLAMLMALMKTRFSLAKLARIAMFRRYGTNELALKMK